jgi:hypothetical protein
MDAIKRRFRPGHPTPAMVERMATLLDDQAGGADDRVDPGVETLHLAAFLLNAARGELKPAFVPRREAIERYRAKVLPHSPDETRLAAELHYDTEGATMAQRSHHAATAPYWRAHFKINKKNIMRAVALVKRRSAPPGGRPVVMALGAGSCADIPLKEIVAAGCDVILVDLDLPSMKMGIAMQLTPAQRRHVTLETRDLTEGAIHAISTEARRIIERQVKSGGTPGRARAELNALFRRQAVSVPQLEGRHRVDLLVSSLLVGQLPVFPAKSIGRWFEAAFREPLARAEADMLAQSAFGDRLFDAHFEALADFVVRGRAAVYFSSDLFIMPSFYDLRAREERYGPPRPVLGYRGQPLADLDAPFERNPGLQLVSRSAGGAAGSDHWIWNQQPAQLAKVDTLKLRRGGRVVKLRGKKGMVRAIDAVILAPRGWDLGQAPR